MDKVYYDPGNTAAFSTQARLEAAVGSKRSVLPWLLQQDAYTLHRPLRKKFLRNPYFVTNIGELVELDLIDLQAYAKHNDGVRYLLNAIDVFSKYAYAVPLLSKTGVAVTKAFRFIVEEEGMPPPVVQTDRG